MWYKNIAGRFFGLVTKHACHRWTDRQNYDSQDRASIAASRSKNKSYRSIQMNKKCKATFYQPFKFFLSLNTELDSLAEFGQNDQVKDQRAGKQ